MDRTAVTVAACLSMSRSSGRGFAGGGRQPAWPGVEAATEELGSGLRSAVRQRQC
jgi:hypothetical protein